MQAHVTDVAGECVSAALRRESWDPGLMEVHVLWTLWVTAWAQTLPLCGDLAVRGADPTAGAATCEGADLRFDTTGTWGPSRGCADDGAGQLWVPVWATGTADVDGLQIDLTVEGGDQAPGLGFAIHRCAIRVPRGTGVAIGPFDLPDVVLMQVGLRASFTLPGACAPPPDGLLFGGAPWGLDLDTSGIGPPRPIGDDLGAGEVLPVVTGEPCPGLPDDLVLYDPVEDTDAAVDDTDIVPRKPDTGRRCGCDQGALSGVWGLALAALFLRRR